VRPRLETTEASVYSDMPSWLNQVEQRPLKPMVPGSIPGEGRCWDVVGQAKLAPNDDDDGWVTERLMVAGCNPVARRAPRRFESFSTHGPEQHDGRATVLHTAAWGFESLLGYVANA
jgi:hypothetical protein